MDFKKSYIRHKEAYKKSNIHIDSVINPNRETIDYYRHQRFYSCIKPFLRLFPKSSWLTIGDGKYGQDSIRLKEIQPSISIIPTDISPYLLERAKKRGIIDDYKEENAENLSFKDNTFDFVFCKESFHHFPRPYLGIYEMLRVAKKAIILIEPNDQIPYPIIGEITSFIKKGLKILLNKKQFHHDSWRFEESGNYVYTLSKREFEKIALGLGLQYVGIMELNDYFSPIISKELIKSHKFKIFKRKLQKLDLLNKLGYSKATNIVGVIFKEAPSEEIIEILKQSGFNIICLPENPY